MAAHVVKWLQKGKVNRWLVILTFMFIPVFLLLVFTYIPFVKMMGFSFFDMKYIGKREYVGIQNYLDVFQRDDCFKALRLSFYYIGACFVQMSLALYFASVLSTNIRCGNLFKGFMFFPYLICGIAVGFIFKFFYTRGFVFDTVLSWFGFTQDQLPYWLKDTRINNISIAATSIWRYMGQNMVLFIGAIMSVDSTMYEAAAIDGADEWKKFRYIVFPSIKTVIVLNLILSITGSLSAFEPPYVITNGSFGTATYFVVMNKLAHENQKVGLASAMAVILLVIILAATLFQKLIFRYFFGEGEEESWREKRMRRKREMISRKEGA
ncbi:carbohydrate ABC transporter permease [Lacrimispora xylanolytica]|jgi:multiple sugar transport system permease protein|uniref:Sugar ABC transporter permease n=2 Tax=Clostridia TaxID=186801 RepID=A0ABY7AJK2_9FIRM|nr:MULTISPECIES: sugar ABC transporter permease [Clostridia]WAJ25968.1 sugar ABC transporter permease [Lacrimispora xylanolytica]